MRHLLPFTGEKSAARRASATWRDVALGLAPLIVVFFHLSWTEPAAAKSYETRKTVGNYEVALTLEKNPPMIGDNPIEIDIKDGSGKSVTDATVLVNYYMPPMPRMAPMNYTTEAGLKKQKYRAALKFIMAGPWYIAVKINRGGKMMTVKINVDAR